MHREHEAGDQLTGQAYLHVAEVHLRLGPRPVGLRNEGVHHPAAGPSTEPVDKALEPPCAERLQLVSATIGWGRSDREIAIRARVHGRVVGELRTGGAATAGQYK
ncbi:hypothetical protein [Streptomyces phaeochromogenes]